MMARWNGHVNLAKRSNGQRSHFAAAIRKYGKDAFSHEVLETCETLEEANAAEERWIEKLGTRDPERGFNLMRGGLHTPHPIQNVWDRPGFRERHAASVRAVVSLPEQRLQNSLRMKGLYSSPEERDRLSRQGSEIASRPDLRELKRTLWKDHDYASRCSPQLRRGAERERKKSNCPAGHPYLPETTIVGERRYRGKTYATRTCRICAVARTMARDKANPRPKTCACGAKIRRKSRRCNDCKYRSQLGRGERVAWPPLESLVEEIQNTSASAVSRRLGVSYQAVLNRVRRHSDRMNLIKAPV